MANKYAFSLLAKRLEGKVALITGGASGIGKCTAHLFALHGTKVIIADIQDELGTSVASSIGLDSASFVHCDVANESDIRNAVDFAVAKHGKLDVMFNNAGIIDAPKPILDYDQAEFERVVRVITSGTFLGTKHAARVMIPARCGSIISTASVASVSAGSGTQAYTCAKHAVAGLTKSAAMELGRFGIRVNCVSPYGVATPLTMQFSGMTGEEKYEMLEKALGEAGNLKGTVLKAEDVAQAALYLASDEAKYVSGHNLLVDGGFTVVNPSLQAFNATSHA